MPIDFKKPCTFTLSANEIRTFCECPRKRYYSSRDCLALRGNSPRGALLLGDAFHKGLQYYYTEMNRLYDEFVATHGGEIPGEYDLLDLLDSIPTFEPPMILDENGNPIQAMDAAQLAMLNNMLTIYKERIPDDIAHFEVLSCEQTFSIENWPITDVMYHGYVDMVIRERENGLIYFFEHKTCKDFRPEIYDRFDIQLHLYGYYGALEYGENFGGIVLNQVKKAKTDRGYANDRKTFHYSIEELEDFKMWLTQKTRALISPDNIHAPCNNYMSCKMCEYANICLKYGYEVPKTPEQITEDASFVDGTEKPLYSYCPRESAEETENMEDR